MIRSNYLSPIILFLLLCLMYGCGPGIKREAFETRPETRIAPVLSPDSIDRKISALEELLMSNAINEKERTMANELLSDYRLIRSFLREDAGTSDNRELIRILFRNLDRLDQHFLLGGGGLEENRRVDIVHEYSQKKRKIKESYLSGNYPEVIKGCVELESSYGPGSITPEVGLLFAESLAENGRLDEAIRVGENIVQELEGRPGLIHLRVGLIQWHLASGNSERADHAYEKLVDDMDEREILFKNMQEKMTGGRPYSPVHGTGFRQTDGGGVFRESDTIDDILDKVDFLLRRQSFSRARLLLIKWRLRHEEEPHDELIENALEEVERAEKRAQKERLSEREAVEEAMKLIEEEKFEEAISELDYWAGPDNPDPNIRKMRVLAVERLIRRERDKAAKIFLQAKNTSDPKRKRELLLSSINILKKLIEKYPSSSLIHKLNNHLMRVTEELEKTGGPSG